MPDYLVSLWGSIFYLALQQRKISLTACRASLARKLSQSFPLTSLGASWAVPLHLVGYLGDVRCYQAWEGDRRGRPESAWQKAEYFTRRAPDQKSWLSFHLKSWSSNLLSDLRKIPLLFNKWLHLSKATKTLSPQIGCSDQTWCKSESNLRTNQMYDSAADRTHYSTRRISQLRDFWTPRLFSLLIWE